MRLLEKNSREIYFCKRVLANDIELFEQPVLLKINPLSISSVWNAETVGAVETGKLLFVLDASVYADMFTRGDRFYIYAVPSGDFDGSAQDADYILTGIAPAPNTVALTLKRLAT